MMTITLQSHTLESPTFSLPETPQSRQKADLDRYLIEQIECGCQIAMKILYDKYYKPLTSFINACMTQDQYKAKILHNSFLDIWSGHKIWNRRQSVKVFILSIVKKKINALNEVGRKFLFHDDARQSSTHDSDIKTKASDLQGPLANLSSAHRGLLFLLHKESLSYEQISIIENCSVESVKKQFLDLLRRLKTQTN